MDGIDIHKENIANVEIVSGSAKPNGSCAGMDKSALGKETKGVGETGRMKAKLQELERRKSEWADLQAKTDEDIKTLRNALHLLGP